MSPFRSFRRPAAAPRSREPLRSRPGVEALENRLVPAAVGTPIQNFVDQVYRDFAGRAPTTAELQSGTALLEQGGTRMQFVLSVEQLPEYRAQLVTRYFSRIEERAPSPAELNAGVAFLESGGTLSRYAASLLDDPAYFQKNGGNTDRFVRDVFEDLFQANNALPNDPHQRAEAGWIGLLHGHQANRAEFIRLLTTGLPFRIQLVQDHFQDLLGQSAPDAAVRGFSTFEFRHGDDATAARIASSDAYFLRAQQALVVQQQQQQAAPSFSDNDTDGETGSDMDGDGK